MKEILKAFCEKAAFAIFGMALLIPQGIRAQAVTAMNSKPLDPVSWATWNFTKGKVPPFSFVYDGVNSSDLIRKWEYSRSEIQKWSDGSVTFDAGYRDNATGLEVTCSVKAFPEYGTVEWVLNFTNNSTNPSGRISDVKVVDLRLRYPDKGEFKLHYADGSHVSKQDFHPRLKIMEVGDSHSMWPEGGRSSQVSFPFFNIESPGDQGVIVAVGWTGTWLAQVERHGEDNINIATGMKYLDTWLHPGESIRTPSTALLFWNSPNRLDGHNKFRRFILAHHTHKIDGRRAEYPVSTSFNYGDPSPCNEYTCLTAEYAVAMVNRYRQFGLVPEVFWLDAGWHVTADDYANGKNWANTIGNWTVDPVKFPDGMKPISDAVHDAGAKFMVWFEPERVIKGTEWAVEHPGWMLDASPDHDAYLFDLGNPEARDWMCERIGDMIEENGIDYYRQDFNMEPDVFWRNNDEPGRTGIREIRHIEGLYYFWDYLMTRFPGLIVDNCASGGRRIDLESTSRSAPLWRTDYQYGEPVGYQCHTYGLNLYLPISGTGLYKTERFTFRSSLGTSVIYNWKITDPSNNFLEMQKCMQEFLDVRPYFYEDYYPLTGYGDTTADDIWLAYQLNRPSDRSGWVVAFRRENCPDRTAVVRFEGLDSGTLYTVGDYEQTFSRTLSGRELAEGYELVLDEPRSSLLLFYRSNDTE